MQGTELTDLYVSGELLLPTPRQIKDRLPISAENSDFVCSSRRAVRDVLDRKDHRLCVVVGPCSIHDADAAIDYAKKLKDLSAKVSDTLLIVMRVYFAKPRTTVGWKGLINDPFLDDSFRIDEGLFLARKLLLELAELRVPIGTEALDSITPQFIDDLITWSAIGARTAESQTHREMASGLSTPVGFKNGTDGNIRVAINGLQTMCRGHAFLGINQDGQCVVLQTTGNPYGHIILRGGERPNYGAESIKLAEAELAQAKLPQNIVVDCSHGNSLKDHNRQPLVFNDCVGQIRAGNRSIVGLMLESNLFAGKQELTADRSQLAYGVSITDACLDWQTTEELLLQAADQLKTPLKERFAQK